MKVPAPSGAYAWSCSQAGSICGKPAGEDTGADSDDDTPDTRITAGRRLPSVHPSSAPHGFRRQKFRPPERPGSLKPRRPIRHAQKNPGGKTEPLMLGGWTPLRL